jgi:hypothetical protein
MLPLQNAGSFNFYRKYKIAMVDLKVFSGFLIVKERRWLEKIG